MSKLAIRKALESQLVDYMETKGFTTGNIALANKAFTSKGKSEYLKTSPSFGRDFETELGLDPRIERSGRFFVGVRTDPNLGQDRNDVVAEWVREAFPYGLELERDGIRVSIRTTDDSECMPDGSYLFSPVYVNFTVWSTTNA